MRLDKWLVVRKRAAVWERERERWIDCKNIRKWEDDEGERELWKLGGDST